MKSGMAGTGTLESSFENDEIEVLMGWRCLANKQTKSSKDRTVMKM